MDKTLKSTKLILIHIVGKNLKIPLKYDQNNNKKNRKKKKKRKKRRGKKNTCYIQTLTYWSCKMKAAKKISKLNDVIAWLITIIVNRLHIKLYLVRRIIIVVIIIRLLLL